MLKMRLFLLLGLIGITSQGIFCQDVSITLNNASFEDIPRHSHAPRGWSDCGFPNESPPDVQPSGFSVNKKAYEGNTYLGLVVRDNDTWEAVSQKLSAPMESGKCYDFSIFLARSELYVSPSQITGKEANYTTPAKLRVYGGFGYCDKQYLLAESSLVINTRWIEFSFKFEPIDNYTHLVFEAFYKTPSLFPYNGNVLVDNASELREIPCDESAPLAEEEVIEEETETPTPLVAESPRRKPQQVLPEREGEDMPATPVAEESPAKKGPRYFAGQEVKAKNQIIRIENLFFEVDAADIQKESYTELNNLYKFLADNKDVVIEIGGHTNNVPTEHWYCDSLSTARAKAVADYLAGKGIDYERLEYKGYGKRKPAYTNKTEYGRRKNQRVEIKILSIG